MPDKSILKVLGMKQDIPILKEVCLRQDKRVSKDVNPAKTRLNCPKSLHNTSVKVSKSLHGNNSCQETLSSITAIQVISGDSEKRTFWKALSNPFRSSFVLA
ncbi:hypothetical protein CDAR_390001 [Caerostris darwini]|uniref:Uncharacterized protein n=1 Tax=Caerostris darwini TaxID=1538125 RepID=A0AAV4MUE3_9ARAC|nr:hypothetical protein CDAR_390001 [Caerostris darwini]